MTILPLAGIIFIIAVGVVLLIQQFHKNLYRQKLEAEELKYKHQADLLRSSIKAQEEERKRIAHDMHDELGAVLSIAKMHLVQLEEKEKNRPGELLTALRNIRSLTETSMASMRRISHVLMPPQLETFGLVKTLESFARQANSAGGTQIHIKSEGNLLEIPWETSLGLYRIIMELVNNTIRHAGANNITIELENGNGNVRCIYTDDGRGMTPASEWYGIGFKSMEGRLSSLRGTMEFPGPDKGFRVVISIPLN